MRKRLCASLCLVSVCVAALVAQNGPGGANANAARQPRTVLLDADGRLLTDEEFVDIRMANFHEPDATISRTLDDGRRELITGRIRQEGTLAPNFFGKLVDGTEIELSQLRGKVVVLNFWFMGCPACETEEPRLFELRSKFARDPRVEFLAMTGDTGDAVRKYFSRRKTNYRHITDASEALEAFTFGGYPKNIVIGKDGKIVYWRSTVKAWGTFESVIRAEAEK